MTRNSREWESLSGEQGLNFPVISQKVYISAQEATTEWMLLMWWDRNAKFFYTQSLGRLLMWWHDLATYRES